MTDDWDESLHWQQAYESIATLAGFINTGNRAAGSNDNSTLFQSDNQASIDPSTLASIGADFLANWAASGNNTQTTWRQCCPQNNTGTVDPGAKIGRAHV